MFNDRPIENPRLQSALNEVGHIMQRYGLAGACMLVSEEESAYTYAVHAPWSAFRADPNVPLGFRLRANSKADGAEITNARVLAAMHTICTLADFAAQTAIWMADLQEMARNAGIEFEHTSFGAKPLPRLGRGS